MGDGRPEKIYRALKVVAKQRAALNSSLPVKKIKRPRGMVTREFTRRIGNLARAERQLKEIGFPLIFPRRI